MKMYQTNHEAAHLALFFSKDLNRGKIIIHRLNDEYITVFFVPGSLIRSTKECKLRYFMSVPESLLNFTVIRNSSRKILIVV